jgi:hypothetical protein
MKAHLFNPKIATMRGAIAILVIGTALVAVGSAQASHVPSHEVPIVECSSTSDGRMRIAAHLPSWVYSGSDRNGVQFRSEPISLQFHLLQKVNGVWTYVMADDQFFTNYATSGGFLLGGWLPDGKSSSFGASKADFYTGRGEFKLAMVLQWNYSGNYVYEWAGQHYYFNGWTGATLATSTCVF